MRATTDQDTGAAHPSRWQRYQTRRRRQPGESTPLGIVLAVAGAVVVGAVFVVLDPADRGWSVLMAVAVGLAAGCGMAVGNRIAHRRRTGPGAAS